MTALTTFNFDNATVRTVTINGDPWFALVDLCNVLGIVNTRNVAARLDDDMKDVRQMDTPGGRQNMTIVSEAGMYDVIVRSDSPLATPFRRWITTEVLPSIRRTGSYGTPTVPDLTALTPDVVQYLGHISQALTLAVETAQVNKEKADGFDAFLNGEGHYLIGTVARMLGVGQQTFFNWLYAERILIKGGPRHRQPYADRADWFEVFAHDTAYTNGKAATTTYFTPTGAEKCRQYLTKRGYLKPQLLELTTGALT